MKLVIFALLAALLACPAFAAPLTFNAKNINIDIDSITRQIESLLMEQYGNFSNTTVTITGMNTSISVQPGSILNGTMPTPQIGAAGQNQTGNQTQQGAAVPQTGVLWGQDIKKQVINVALIAGLLCYIFAAGRIADYLLSSGKRITKKEAVFVPFAYLATSAIFVIIYLTSGFFAPPQATIVTLGFFLVVVPALITLAAGTAVIYWFFRDRIGASECFSLSLRIIFAPIFDGIKGYWTALGAAVIIAIVSTLAFFSSGGNMALATTDFLFLSITVSLYFVYKAAVAQSNEERASSLTTLLFILSPSIIRIFARDIACAVIGAIPVRLFSSCPLAASDQQTSLALSLAATFIVLLPLIPIAYAALVNALRATTVFKLLAAKDPQASVEKGADGA